MPSSARTRWLALAVGGIAVLAALASASLWSSPSATSTTPGLVVGTQTTPEGRTNVKVTGSGLQPGAEYRVLMSAVSGPGVGASVGVLGSVTADEAGAAKLTADVVTVAAGGRVPLVEDFFAEPGALISMVSSSGETVAEIRVVIPVDRISETPTLPDGVTFVLVRGVTDGALVVDPAQFLSGDDALVAAREDGAIASGEVLPNDFYLRNTVSDERAVPVRDDARFTLIGFDAAGALEEVEVDAATLLHLLTGGEPLAVYGLVPTEFPMTLSLDDGAVAGGRQQYMP